MCLTHAAAMRFLRVSRLACSPHTLARAGATVLGDFGSPTSFLLPTRSRCLKFFVWCCVNGWNIGLLCHIAQALECGGFSPAT